MQPPVGADGILIPAIRLWLTGSQRFGMALLPEHYEASAYIWTNQDLPTMLPDFRLTVLLVLVLGKGVLVTGILKCAKENIEPLPIMTIVPGEAQGRCRSKISTIPA